jgi:uncharacterized protein (TIGR02217 family)
MEFVNIEFPPRIAYGVMRDAAWSTTAVRTFGGYTSTNQNWDRTQYSFDLSFAVRTIADYRDIVAHFHQVRGRARKCPFKDYLDFEVAAADGVATLITGSTYQLGKTYGATNPFVRKITRPKSGTCTFYRTRSAVQSTISPTVDYATGQITVTGHAEGDTYQWAGEFDLACAYRADTLPGAIINRKPADDYLVQCESILIEEIFE